MDRIYPESFVALAKLSERFVVVVPPDQRNPFDCVNCGGVGYMYYWNFTGGPYRNHPGKNSTYIDGEGWYAGQLVGDYCPVCNGNMKTHFMRMICGLNDDDLSIRIDDFKSLPGKADALDYARLLLSLTPLPTGFSTIWGDYGAGKTTLLKALVNGFRVANVTTKYIRMSDVLDEIRRSFGDNVKGATQRIVDDYGQFQALMIDEVDRVYMTEWARDVMFSLLDTRYNLRNRKLTLMATNIEPNSMPDDLKYLASRMSEGVVVKVGGADIRGALGLREQNKFKTEAKND